MRQLSKPRNFTSFIILAWIISTINAYTVNSGTTDIAIDE